MAATPVAFASIDDADPQLDSGISAATLSIPLKSGHGARLPQPYSSTATSVGTNVTLNCTGISATIGGSAQVGKWIWNKTDGSVAIITAVATNAVTTTRLLGGTDNTWDNSDTWCIDPFVATFAIVATSAYGVKSITTSEQALVTGRSTDTLTVPTGGRGYNSTVANTFSADDYVYLFSTSPIVERFKDLVSVMAVQQNTDRTTLAAEQTNIDALQDGTYHYVVTTGSADAYVAATPALAAYTAGNMIVFKANFTNTGAATLNVNGLGAIAIKKNDGATALSANDIISGQIVEVRYEATTGFFQMISPVGTPATSTYYNKIVAIGPGSSSTSGTGATDFATTYTIPANDLVDGVGYRYTCFISNDGTNATTFELKLGSTVISTHNITPPSAGAAGKYEGVVMGTAAAGASVSVSGESSSSMGNGANGRVSGSFNGSAAVATNGTLVLKLTGTTATSGTTSVARVVIEKFSTTAFA